MSIKKLFVFMSLQLTLFSGLCSAAILEPNYLMKWREDMIGPGDTSINHYTATITSYGNEQSQELVNYYQDQYGIGLGSIIDFTIMVDKSQPAEFTDDDGNRDYFYFGVVDNYGLMYSEEEGRYAELTYISIDEELLNYGVSRDNAYMNVTNYEGWDHELLSVENNLYITETSNETRRFGLSINDGTGELYLKGNNWSFSSTPHAVPIPAAAWLLISGIGGCCIFRRKSKAM